MESNPQYASLMEMGCNPALSEAAIRQLKTEDIMALLDWIENHSEEEQKWAQWLKDNQNSSQNKGGNEQGGEGQSIQKLINKEMSDTLMAKGHSKNVSEKALLLTGNVSVQSAQKWIQEHKYEPDFEEELRLQGQAYNESNLTPEQAKAKLEQLTKKAREIRKQREEQEAREREKNRLKFTKEMQDAKRIADEQAMKRKVELDKIEKQRDEEYKKKLVEQMRRERNAKLGIKEEELQPVAVQLKKEEKKLSLIEQIQIQCEQVKVGNHAYPDVAKTFFETAQIYVTNIIKNNGEQKFRKINKENKAFQNRICAAFGGLQFLHVLGYVEEDNALILKNYDMKELQKVNDLLARYKAYY